MPVARRALVDLPPWLRRASALARPRAGGLALPGLEAALPGGVEPGTLVDLHADPGAGALALALRAAARCQAPGRAVVVLDPAADVYAPALAQVGLAPARTLVLRPDARDALDALDEALRAPVVAATVARVAGLSTAASHRLRLAARLGGGLGLLVRPRSEVGAISGAPVRVLVLGGGREGGGPRVVALRVRGGASGAVAS